MAKYRKKAVVIEAIECAELMKALSEDFWSMPHWIVEAYEKANIVFMNHPYKHMKIHTLEGWHEAGMTDMIIQGVKGEIYPCKADIFEMTYEKVDENG